MLVNLKEILEIAEKEKIAIGAFNTPNITSLKAIIAAAEELKKPVIIMHAQLHEDIGVCKMEDIIPVMLTFAKRASVPVCVMLDHGTDIDYVKRGLELGFTGVMYDGSHLSPEENIENTKTVVNEAKKYGASVEAEVGSMGERSDGMGHSHGPSIYTEPEDAVSFAKETGVDALTCAFGTVHGFYKDVPKLDFERISKIYSLLDVPIVMHGGSGISKEDFRKVITRGVRKVNYYTYMSKAGAEAVSNKEYTQFHDLLLDAEKAMKDNVINAINVFSLTEV